MMKYACSKFEMRNYNLKTRIIIYVCFDAKRESREPGNL